MAITENTVYRVRNRSTSIVVYKIPELNVRREFAPGESKKITFGELEKLTFQEGGRELLENFLQIEEEVVTRALNMHREAEYDMTERQIDELLLRGSLDAFLDALDFAPMGVIDLIKSRSVSLPLTDLNKRRALRDKTGFDVDRAIAHVEEEQRAQQQETMSKAENKPQRRVVANTPETPSAPARRTTPSYKVVAKKENN